MVENANYPVFKKNLSRKTDNRNIENIPSSYKFVLFLRSLYNKLLSLTEGPDKVQKIKSMEELPTEIKQGFSQIAVEDFEGSAENQLKEWVGYGDALSKAIRAVHHCKSDFKKMRKNDTIPELLYASEDQDLFIHVCLVQHKDRQTVTVKIHFNEKIYSWDVHYPYGDENEYWMKKSDTSEK